jgi:hypothetical protein
MATMRGLTSISRRVIWMLNNGYHGEVADKIT